VKVGMREIGVEEEWWIFLVSEDSCEWTMRVDCVTWEVISGIVVIE